MKNELQAFGNQENEDPTAGHRLVPGLHLNSPQLGSECVWRRDKSSEIRAAIGTGALDSCLFHSKGRRLLRCLIMRMRSGEPLSRRHAAKSSMGAVCVLRRR